MPDDSALARAIAESLRQAGACAPVRSGVTTRRWQATSPARAPSSTPVWPARELDPGAAVRTRILTARRAPWGFYGHEAAALILDAVAAAGADRAGVLRTVRRTRDRESPLGRYSVDEDGLTTGRADGVLAVVDGEIVWDRLSEERAPGRPRRSGRPGGQVPTA